MLEEAINFRAMVDSRSVDTFIISLDDRISCNIEFGTTLKELHQYRLLEKFCIDVEQKFEGIPKSFYFIKFKSDIYLEQDEIKKALHVLMRIPSVSCHCESHSKFFSVTNSSLINTGLPFFHSSEIATSRNIPT